MATHIIKGHRSLTSWILGTGWVETQCGMEVPADNGPDSQDSVNCRECQNASGSNGLFLGIF